MLAPGLRQGLKNGSGRSSCFGVDPRAWKGSSQRQPLNNSAVIGTYDFTRLTCLRTSQCSYCRNKIFPVLGFTLNNSSAAFPILSSNMDHETNITPELQNVN